MQRWCRWFIVVQIFLLNICFADDKVLPPPPSPNAPIETPAAPISPTPTDHSAFFKMLTALIIILAIVIFVVWLIKALGRGRFSRGGKAQHIEIIERRSLSQKSMLYLIEIDGERVLIAESQHHVTALNQSPAMKEEA